MEFGDGRRLSLRPESHIRREWLVSSGLIAEL